jgi:hypothetical protein
MAVVAVKSNLITNIEASPPVQNTVTVDGARRRSSAAFVALANGDSATSVYRMFRAMSHWRIIGFTLYCDAITSGTINLGIRRTTADGGAVVADTAYASAQAISSAIVTGTNIAFQNRSIAKIAQSVWQDAGLAADPKLAYDICMILQAGTTAAGNVGIEMVYAAD